MPLFDLQWALSLINERTLEQAGIVANFFAGILLAIDHCAIRLSNYVLPKCQRKGLHHLLLQPGKTHSHASAQDTSGISGSSIYYVRYSIHQPFCAEENPWCPGHLALYHR